MAQLIDWCNSQFGSSAASNGLIAGAIGNYGLQNAAQQLQQQGVYYAPATNTYTTTTSTVMSMDDYNRLMGVAQKVVKKVAQKTGKILLDLRREIEDWHGDVLCRAA